VELVGEIVPGKVSEGNENRGRGKESKQRKDGGEGWGIGPVPT